MCLVGCSASPKHARVCQGRICVDNCTCCLPYRHRSCRSNLLPHLVTDTDTRSTSPSADPVTPGTCQGSHWGYQSSCHSTLKKPLGENEDQTQVCSSRAIRFTTRQTRRFEWSEAMTETLALTFCSWCRFFFFFFFPGRLAQEWIGWLCRRLVGWLVGWLAGPWLVGWMNDWLGDWLGFFFLCFVCLCPFLLFLCLFLCISCCLEVGGWVVFVLLWRLVLLGCLRCFSDSGGFVAVVCLFACLLSYVLVCLFWVGVCKVIFFRGRGP